MTDINANADPVPVVGSATFNGQQRTGASVSFSGGGPRETARLDCV